MKRKEDNVNSISKEDVKEYYYRRTNGDFLVMVYFTKLDRHMEIELNKSKEVTGVSIRKGPIFNFETSERYKSLKLMSTRYKLGLSDEQWEKMILTEIKELIQPISDEFHSVVLLRRKKQSTKTPMVVADDIWKDTEVDGDRYE